MMVISVDSQLELGGNEEGKFMIDCEHGFIKLARPLDRERCASYNLTVQVTDGSAKATAMVHVEVLDANDNWPVFSESLYQVEVSESSSPGTEILQLTATDADEDQRLFYSIHNSEPQRRAVWLRAINRDDPDDMGTQIGFVCSDHFLPEDYETNLKILRSLGFDTKNAHLKRDAILTQNLSLGARPRKRGRSEASL
ncbi:hypothetical protein HPB52_022376 [Rhipicephalus sanguineus]|uniref:Cadherin domain-containing protein n=1 Tax=Rhipicephalus sanguineus TaxID=34632 RepID=A0A9D4T394_RHISA|nr:hypothetical protein HPB52_022376 [Rhipicephalus sanguineus]